MLFSTVAQATLVAVVFLCSMFQIQSLPTGLWSSMLIAPSPPPSPEPAPPVGRAQTLARPIARLIPAKLEAPRAIPRNVELASAVAPPDLSGSGPLGVPLVSPGTLGGILGGIGEGPLPPELVRVGGQVMEAKRLDQTMPVYPPAALKKHVMGTVSVHATISKEGRVTHMRVISGDPLLIQSALDAIARFQYEPTMLNGLPIEVDTRIDVIFRLNLPPPRRKK